MEKFFNTAGPVDPADHYYIPGRLQTAQLHMLIDQKKYFVMHAPRQTGKTTTIRQFVDELNKEERYKALCVNVEPAQPWLVNALAYEACFRDVTDRRQPITKAVLERARETLIKRRDTHLDALVERLNEPRVRAIVVDLLVTWPAGGGRGVKGARGRGTVRGRSRPGSGKEQRMVIEIKVLRSPKTEAEGLTQTGSSMRTADATEGHRVIFDRTEGKRWDEKIYQHDVKRGSRVIHVWGM